MSLAQEQKSLPAVQTPRVSFLRSVRFPLVILVLFGLIIAIPWVIRAMDIETGPWAVYLGMMTQWLAPPLAAIILALWWVFLFRGIGWLARLLVLTVVIGGVVAFFKLSVRKFELSAKAGSVSLEPRIHWVWDPSPEEKLTEYLKKKGDELPAIDATVGPEDFPSYRGPKQDGVISLVKLQRDWNAKKPVVVWRHPCPEGYSGIAVAGNIAVTLEQRGEKEVVACYDRATGRQRWAHGYPALHHDIMGDGPRSTPTIHDKHVYSIGATGELVCLTVEGKLVWSKNILELAKSKNVQWGLSGSPLIVDDLVIANAGFDPLDPKAPVESSVIAFDKATGDVRWKVGKRKAGYSSPQLVKLGNVPQILLFDGAGLVSYDPKTGKELWTHKWITDYEMNSIQPVIIGDDRVFLSSEAANGCALVRVTAKDASWTVEPVWENKNVASRYANPVTDGKFIYCLHDLNGALRSLDVKDGKMKWRGERYGPGQMLLVNDLLLIVNGDTGDVSLLDTASSSPEELGRFTAFEERDKTWNTPALAGDQLFLRNQAEIVCVKLPRR